MRLTRRGFGVVAVCISGFVLAGVFSPRSLNAIVLPCLVVLVAAYLQVRTLPSLRAVRDLPPADSVGSTHTVTLTLDDAARPFVGTVREELSAGLSSDGTVVDVAVGDESIVYDVTYESRGRQTLGPVHVVGSDVLGLVEVDDVYSQTDRLLVYPRVHPLTGWARRDLLALRDPDQAVERDQFDGLREYVRGDALRDVHWKSSAKRDDLIITEYSGAMEAQAITIAGSAIDGSDDQLAEAAVSIALAYHDADVPVTLALPNGTVETEPDHSGRTRLLEQCALTGSGTPDPSVEADVVIEANERNVTVEFGAETTTFDALCIGYGRRPSAREHRDEERSDAADQSEEVVT